MQKKVECVSNGVSNTYIQNSCKTVIDELLSSYEKFKEGECRPISGALRMAREHSREMNVILKSRCCPFSMHCN